MGRVGKGTRKLRRALRRLAVARSGQSAPEAARDAAPPLTLAWGLSMEQRIRRMDMRLERLERLIGGGVLLTVLVEVALRLAERWL